MNMISDTDRKLVEALKSLSIDEQVTSPPSRGPHHRRILLAVLLTTALGAGLGLMLWPQATDRVLAMLPGMPQNAIGGPAADSPPKNPVTIASAPGLAAGNVVDGDVTVRAAPLRVQEIAGSGYVTARHSTSVFARHQGTITTMEVEVGDSVALGQVLARLDGVEVQFALEDAQLAKASAILTLEARRIDKMAAQDSFARAETLTDRGAITRQQHDTAEVDLRRAENAMMQAEQAVAIRDLALRRAQDAVNHLVVRAPFAGVVTRLNARVGDSVLAQVDSMGPDGGLLTLTDTATLLIDADVSEQQTALLQAGLKGAAVLDGFPNRPFAVEVLHVAPIASAEKGTIALQFRLIDPPVGIRPNMAARITLSVTDPKS